MTRGIEPIGRTDVMAKFDKLLLRAAENKRKEIVDRYGQEGCEKLLAKQEGKKEDPEFTNKNYESTIRNLMDSWEASPQNKAKKTKTIDEVVSDGAWLWGLPTDEPESPKPKKGSKRNLQSRRRSFEV